METLRRKFGGSHELVQLITQCLEYSPARRPSASEALQRLQHISSQVVDHYHNMTCLQLEKLLIEKDGKKTQEEVNKLGNNLLSPSILPLSPPPHTTTGT